VQWVRAIPRAFDQWAASSLSVHPAYAAITRALVGQFRAVGVELRVLELDANATYQRLRAGDFDVSIASSVVSDSDGSLSQYLASDGAFNWGALREPAMDDAVQALQRDGPATFSALYDRIDVDAPFVMLFQDAHLLLMARHLRGVEPQRGGLRFADWWLTPDSR